MSNLNIIRRRVTSQGTFNTCAFHSVLNAFLITPGGRKLFSFALRNYTRNLSQANRTMFNNPAAVYTNREVFFWKAVSLLLSDSLNTRLCSLNLARTFVPNLRSNQQMSVFQIVRNLFNASPSLKSITEIEYNGLALNNRVPPLRKCMSVKIFTANYNATRAEQSIDNDRLFLDHAFINIGGPGVVSHFVTGIVYNRVQYIVDSSTQSVTQCDWANYLPEVLSIPFIAHYRYSTVAYAGLVYIKRALNYTSVRHAIDYVTRPGRARSNASSNVGSASRRTMSLGSTGTSRRNLSNNATSRNLTRRVATLGIRRNTPSPRRPAKKRKVSERANIKI